jgi:asparagine synthase (glutamine-hydrolysing)
MCGICGTTRAGDGGGIQRMNDAMHLRGPDDQGVHLDRDAGIGLGARRLAVIDVAGGHQPLSNEDGTVWAVLNGEIYNHPTLRERLLRQGHRFATGTDTEVLVHLYEEYRDDLVHALEGMYAFAIWDAPRRRLLVARDRFGEKPLFYTDHDGALTFASDLTALRAGAPGPWEIDPAAVDAFFVLGYIPGPGTIFTRARQLPPGHLMTWELDRPGAGIRRYWSPPLTEAGGAGRTPDLVTETRRLLDRSVRSRMVADVPLGVFLSGGTDSTLVAALAVRSSTAPVRTFTVGYDVGAVSEIEAARAAAGFLGTDHHELVLSSGDVAARVPSVLAALDQPLADQALVATHAVSEFARRSVTVAIGGEGADELFCGYPRYAWLDRAERLHRRAPAPALAAAAAALAAAGGRGPSEHLRHLLAAATPAVRRVTWVTAGRGDLRNELYGPGLRHLAAPLQTLGQLPDGELGDWPAGAASMHTDQRVWLPDDILAKADRASMQVSLELRTPYLDRSLAEFACSIPAAVHRAGGGKFLLRAVLAQVLPEGPARRRKIAFRTPTAYWLRGPLRGLVERVVLSGPLIGEGWFDRSALARCAGEHVDGTRDRSNVLWPALALGLWLDRVHGHDGS